MEKVSIIVPVYNAESSIGYCLNSITSQTYTNLEIILVNDGSTDNSLQICKNYAAIDNRIIVVDQKMEESVTQGILDYHMQLAHM